MCLSGRFPYGYSLRLCLEFELVELFELALAVADIVGEVDAVVLDGDDAAPFGGGGVLEGPVGGEGGEGLLHSPEGALHLPGAGKDELRVADGGLAVFIQGNFVLGIGEERHRELLLQPPHGSAEGRLGDMEDLRRRKGARPGKAQKLLQLIQLDHSITLLYACEAATIVLEAAIF